MSSRGSGSIARALEQMGKLVTVLLAIAVVLSAANYWQTRELGNGYEMRKPQVVTARWRTGPADTDFAEVTLERRPKQSTESFVAEFKALVEAFQADPDFAPLPLQPPPVFNAKESDR